MTVVPVDASCQEQRERADIYRYDTAKDKFTKYPEDTVNIFSHRDLTSVFIHAVCLRFKTSVYNVSKVHIDFCYNTVIC